MFLTYKINRLEPSQSNCDGWSEIDLCESVHFFHIAYVNNDDADTRVKNKLIANVELLAKHIQNDSLEIIKMHLISPSLKIDDKEHWEMTKISGISIKEKKNDIRMIYLNNGLSVSSDALDVISDPDKHALS